MFFVTVLHTLGHGGVLRNTFGIKNNIAYLIEIIAICAVNCYAIISGFVMYSNLEKPYRYSKYITMWLQVFFYSFGIGLLAFVFKGGATVGIKQLIKFALPVITKQYWYFSAYTGLFFIVPFLNKFLRVLTKKQFIGIVFLILGFGLIALPIDFLGLCGGYSISWLVTLYVLGAGIKKFEIVDLVSKRQAILCLVICTLVTWLFYVFSPIGPTMLLSYFSPTIVLNAICWVIIFAKLRIGKTLQKIIKFLSPAAFGVYLIHEQGIVRDNLINDNFIWICKLDSWLIPIVALDCALVIFIICISIEKIRLAVFKWLRINQIAESVCYKVEMFLTKHLNKILDYID